MYLKAIPERTCIGCNEKKQKKELIRIVKDKEGNISIDEIGKSNGRGAYICKNICRRLFFWIKKRSNKASNNKIIYLAFYQNYLNTSYTFYIYHYLYN